MLKEHSLKEIFIRYFFVYLSIAILFTIFSFLLDSFFVYLEYTKYLIQEINGLGYLAYFIFRLHLIGLICVIAYNLIINDVIFKFSIFQRYFLAIVLGIVTAVLSKNFLYSNYNGRYEMARAIILCILIFLGVEILRDVKLYYQKRKRII